MSSELWGWLSPDDERLRLLFRWLSMFGNPANDLQQPFTKLEISREFQQNSALHCGMLGND